MLYALKAYLQQPKNEEKKRVFEAVYEKFKKTDVYVRLTDHKLKMKLQEFMGPEQKELM